MPQHDATDPMDISRRGFLGTLGGSCAVLSGCCSMRPFAQPLITQEPPRGADAFLQPQVVKSAAPRSLCVDVHAHFFNASDVPVKGYLEGPVAHSMKEPLRSLVKALAPVADRLADIAPTAAREYADLIELGQRSSLRSAADRGSVLQGLVESQRQETSRAFYEAVRGSEFVDRYNAIQRDNLTRRGDRAFSERAAPLDSGSLERAMRQGSQPQLRKSASTRAMEAQEPYADGVLAFIGFMLSSRWCNLHTYMQAFSAGPDAFGIDHVMGALVDYDRWLDCPPRSAHEDQIKLHQLLARLSGGYMLPVVAYNPWTDFKHHGAARDRVIDAVRNRGFAGVKIYPPNGFRPYGNTLRPVLTTRGAPTPQQLDETLKEFWDACVKLDVPVMAHTNESMGEDAAHDAMGGPLGWAELFKLYQGAPGRPRVNAGHFGGDGAGNAWPEALAQLMGTSEGAGLFGDLGYWSDLRCNGADSRACATAQERLTLALRKPQVASRIMYGSDWLMLAKERDWARYPHDIAAATQGLPVRQADLFGGNARACFGRALGA